jgi:hypothetical protein
MKRVVLLAALAAACVALAIVAVRVAGSEDGAGSAVGPAVLGAPVAQPVDTESPLEGAERRLKVREGTTKAVGQFTLRGGAKLRLDTAETTDGKSCLIDDVSDVGAGSACLEEGLFALRKVAFVVNSEGGPERFDELQLVGVVAPAIGAVSLSKTDGTAVDLRLTTGGAFLFESTTAELELDVLPAALQLLGRNGKLVQTVAIPSLR